MRATTHGFRAQDFSVRCNDKGPTFILMRDDRGEIFGGFTS